ncbi:taste receptor type 2 member 3-like [Suncus etruscus]|uniref:taste receptor type 2 member 3-like n=1 Tax=Suncus etruscus TaxID=109475 RepID=UPI0021104EB3|nr:taste receptor type 2 member 3-like [Suncus etruscus]
MLRLTECLFLVLIIILFVLGLLGNGFIGLVNGKNWFKSRRLSLSDFIITILALSRIILLWILVVDSVLMVLPSKIEDNTFIRKILGTSWTFMNHMSIWLVTCLSVLYCLKVANFSNPQFLWLKWRVSRMVVWMLLGAMLLSCASAMSRFHEYKIYVVTSEIKGTQNVSEYFGKKRKHGLIHALGMLWEFPPLTAMLASYFLLLFSLGRHIQQMQLRGTSSRDSTTDAHKKAIKLIFSFIVLFLLYYILILLSFFRYFLPEPKMMKMIGEAFAIFYSAGHSFILIVGSNKLKQSLVQMIWCETCQVKFGPKGSLAP